MWLERWSHLAMVLLGSGTKALYREEKKFAKFSADFPGVLRACAVQISGFPEPLGGFENAMTKNKGD